MSNENKEEKQIQVTVDDAVKEAGIQVAGVTTVSGAVAGTAGMFFGAPAVIPVAGICLMLGGGAMLYKHFKK